MWPQIRIILLSQLLTFSAIAKEDGWPNCGNFANVKGSPIGNFLILITYRAVLITFCKFYFSVKRHIKIRQDGFNDN